MTSNMIAHNIIFMMMLNYKSAYKTESIVAGIKTMMKISANSDNFITKMFFTIQLRKLIPSTLCDFVHLSERYKCLKI